jgi:hypothetical protein
MKYNFDVIIIKITNEKQFFELKDFFIKSYQLLFGKTYWTIGYIFIVINNIESNIICDTLFSSFTFVQNGKYVSFCKLNNYNYYPIILNMDNFVHAQKHLNIIFKNSYYMYKPKTLSYGI